MRILRLVSTAYGYKATLANGYTAYFDKIEYVNIIKKGM